jgi:PAS domain S-box-containing protein
MVDQPFTELNTFGYQYKEIFQHLPSGVFLIEDNVILDANIHACNLLGYEDTDAVKGTEITKHLTFDALEQYQVLTYPLQNHLNLQFVCKNGSKFEAFARITSFRLSANKFGLLLMLEPDTDQTVSQAEYRAIIDAAPVAIAFFRHGRTVAANRSYEELFRCIPGQGINRTVAQDVGSEAASHHLQERFNILLRLGEVVRFEHRFFRNDGTSFDGFCIGRLINPGANDGFAMVWVIEDITDRYEREKLLKQARSDAEAASRAKTEFLASMSHEIRTPLNGVIGLADMARDESVDELKRQHYLELMSESAQSLLTLISDVLDLAKIEAGKIELDRTHFDLFHLLRSIRTSFAPSTESKGLILDLEIDSNIPRYVTGDPVRIRQILNNYLSNALKFTLKGSIKLKVVRQPNDQIRFEVIDTGLGLSIVEQGRLFQPFEQANRSTSHQFGGTGLGLSICRELSHRMGGEVGVNSEDGYGSTFWVEIPLPSAEGSHTNKIASEPTDLSDMVILLVDDNPINLVVGKGLLERAKAQVIQAKNGLQAIEIIDEYTEKQQRLDAVLMDIQMPIMDGLQATRELRKRPSGKDLPVIATTAAVLQEDVRIALEAGMDGYVSKPFNVKVLIQTVHQLTQSPPQNIPE